MYEGHEIYTDKSQTCAQRLCRKTFRPHTKVYHVAKWACSIGLSILQPNKVGWLEMELASSVETSFFRSRFDLMYLAVTMFITMPI